MNKKTRTHRFSKLPDDGDPWVPNNLLTPEQKKNISWTPVGQATDKKLRPQPTEMNSFRYNDLGLIIYIKNIHMSHFFINSYKMVWLYKTRAPEKLLPQFDRTTCLEML